MVYTNFLFFSHLLSIFYTLLRFSFNIVLSKMTPDTTVKEKDDASTQQDAERPFVTNSVDDNLLSSNHIDVEKGKETTVEAESFDPNLVSMLFNEVIQI